jgi:hypothetical protein
MLAFVTIFVATLLIAATTIWMYRSFAGWQGFKRNVQTQKGKNTAGMKFRVQQGFISMFSTSHENARNKRLRSPKDGIKAPWGW